MAEEIKLDSPDIINNKYHSNIKFIMQKPIYKSMTFWGSLLLGLEVTLQKLVVEHGALEPILTGLGLFLTVFGFRKAMK